MLSAGRECPAGDVRASPSNASRVITRAPTGGANQREGAGTGDRLGSCGGRATSDGRPGVSGVCSLTRARYRDSSSQSTELPSISTASISPPIRPAISPDPLAATGRKVAISLPGSIIRPSTGAVGSKVMTTLCPIPPTCGPSLAHQADRVQHGSEDGEPVRLHRVPGRRDHKAVEPARTAVFDDGGTDAHSEQVGRHRDQRGGIAHFRPRRVRSQSSARLVGK